MASVNEARLMRTIAMADSDGQNGPVPLTATLSDGWVKNPTDLSGVRVTGLVVYSARRVLNAYLPADGAVYAISAYPDLARRLGRISNGLAAFAARASAADNAWQSVCWSPELSLFLASSITGTGNRVMTSPDGITWTIRASAADNSFTSVCWSSKLSLFMAVGASGTGNRAMTSPDGINWTIRASAADNDWRSVCWSPELSLFVASSITGTGDRVMTSPDGINWTSRTTPADNG